MNNNILAEGGRETATQDEQILTYFGYFYIEVKVTFLRGYCGLVIYGSELKQNVNE